MTLSVIVTTCSGFGNGSGRIQSALTIVNTSRLTPTATARTNVDIAR